MKIPERSEFCKQLNKKGGKLITVGIPYHRFTEPEFEESLIPMVSYCKGFNIFFTEVRKNNTNLELARYEIVRDLFDGDYILFADSDQVFPPDAIPKLIRWDKPVVGTLVVQRHPPHILCSGYGSAETGFLKLIKWHPGDLIEVDFTGFGFTLIKREVFEQLPEGNPFMRPFIPGFDSAMGEDISFCRQLKKAEIPIHIDTGVKIGHVGKRVYTVDDYMMHQHLSVEGCQGEPHYEESMNPKVVVKHA